MEANSKKVKLSNKLAFACGDIFGGGSFNVINFLFTPFLTLVVGIPMIHLTWILLFTKIWDGIIDPFIGQITDAKNPGKFGKRRWFMLVCAAPVLVGLVLLFFPWNLITSSVPLKCMFVVIVYMLYATAQSFVLIPYYSHASEMTDDFTERNRTNAVRLAFSIVSSTICVAVPQMIASPEKAASDGGKCYIVMAGIFGVIFMLSILVTALFSREQIVTPSIKTKISVKEYVRPLKVKAYRQYLGMQMCTSMAMAMMSSFFFTLIDFYLRSQTHIQVLTIGSGNESHFPIGLLAAALMFAAQALALPFYLKLIKVKSKRFAYLTGAFIWIGVAAACMFLPGESGEPILKALENGKTSISMSQGTPDWLLMVIGLALGFGIGGAVFIPHSSFGDVCDVGELYFGKRTEGAFSGLTNFLNTTAQAIGLAIPPLVIGLAGYEETNYKTIEEFSALSGISVETLQSTGSQSQIWGNWCYLVMNGNVQMQPLSQPTGAQWAIRICFSILPIIIMAIGCVIAFRYKLTKELQQKIVEANATVDKSTEEFATLRENLLNQL